MIDEEEFKICKQVLSELNEILMDDFIGYEDHIEHIISSHSDTINANYRYLGKRLRQISSSIQKYNDFILSKNDF